MDCPFEQVVTGRESSSPAPLGSVPSAAAQLGWPIPGAENAAFTQAQAGAQSAEHMQARTEFWDAQVTTGRENPSPPPSAAAQETGPFAKTAAAFVQVQPVGQSAEHMQLTISMPFEHAVTGRVSVDPRAPEFAQLTEPPIELKTPVSHLHAGQSAEHMQAR